MIPHTRVYISTPVRSLMRYRERRALYDYKGAPFDME